MRTVNRLHEALAMRLVEVHQGRVRQVFDLAAALMRGGRATLTAIGRAAAIATTEKHGIKRADRCLGNRGLHADLIYFWRAFAWLVLAGNRRPWLLVDWTKAGNGFAALRAAVVVQGRALCVFSRVYRVHRMGNSKVQGSFLKSLKQVLPDGCRPILVTDAGFQGTWFEQVTRLDWDFVGRVRSKIRVRRCTDDNWLMVKDLERIATAIPHDCGEFVVTRERRYRARLVSLDGRTRRAKARRSLRTRKRVNKNAARAARPLIVVTSIRGIAAKKITDIYKTRMQIEETFRDDKSHRYGWGLEYARCRRAPRIEVLLLLIALATTVAVIVALHTIVTNQHRQYQANSIRRRAVLSLVALGRRVLTREPAIPSRQFFSGLRELRIVTHNAHAL